MEPSNQPHQSLGFYIKLTLLAWLSMIGFDFFLHAGLLASVYSQPSPFLLPLDRAFALIPVGYLSFLMLGVFLLWLMLKLKIQSWKSGAIFGLQVGVLLGIAGGVIGYGLTLSSFGRFFVRILIFVFISIMLGIVLQNINFAQIL